jgi:hypothetical protein
MEWKTAAAEVPPPKIGQPMQRQRLRFTQDQSFPRQPVSLTCTSNLLENELRLQGMRLIDVMAGEGLGCGC